MDRSPPRSSSTIVREGQGMDEIQQTQNQRKPLDISPPRSRMIDHSPPRHPRSPIESVTGQSPPRRQSRATSTRSFDHSPPRRSTIAISPPRPSRPADHSPPRQSNPNMSPPRQSNLNMSPPRQPSSTLSPPRPTQPAPSLHSISDQQLDQSSQLHRNQSQIDKHPSSKLSDLWTRVAQLTCKKRYNSTESQKQTALRTAGLDLKFRDPLYLAHREDEKSRVLYLDNKAKHRKLLLEQKLAEQYRMAQETGNAALLQEIELQQQKIHSIEQSNLQNHIRLHSLQIMTTPLRDENGNLIKMIQRPRFVGVPSYQNRFNIPPGYRWDGIDRSLRDEQKFVKK